MKKMIFLLLLIPLKINAQWTYIERIDDSCTPVVTNNYTYSNYSSGAHGAGYNILRNGVIVKSGSGQMGCCTASSLNVFTDSIVFIVINNAGIFECYRTVDAGNTWTLFTKWADINTADITILNENTAFAISRGVYFDQKRISIERISNVRSRYLIKDEIINPLITDVYLTDTIFGESYCPNIQTVGFKIQQNGIDINYHIAIVKSPITAVDISLNDQISIFPNPTSDIFTIESDDVYTIRMFNETGLLISEKQLNKGNNVIDLSNSCKGLYIVNFYKNSNYFTTKKVIKR
jgi:hypothetical protein